MSIGLIIGFDFFYILLFHQEEHRYFNVCMYLGPPILLPQTPNVIKIEVNENEP